MEVALPGQANEAARNALIAYLGNTLVGVANNRIIRLANELIDDIEMAGPERVQAMQATMSEFMTTLSETGRNQLVRVTGGIQRVVQGLDQLTHRLVPPGPGMIWDPATNDWVQGQPPNPEGNRPLIGIDSNGDVIHENDNNHADLPDLEDLFPMNGNGNGSNGNGRGNTNDEPVPEASAARVGVASGATNSVSKETPISNYPNLDYGLPETHTTILPYRTWVSGGLLDHTSPLQLELRMNTVWDMFKSSVTTLADAGTIATKAFHTLPVGPGGVNISTVTFPQTPVNGATERPQWRDWYANMYQYYTVLGCKWKVTIINVNIARGATIEVATQYDSYSDTATSTGNVMPLTTYAETKAFKNIRWDVVKSTGSETKNENSIIISGTYKPGTIKRNIQNDGDVKTWTAVGTSLPSLKEILTLNFFKGGLNYSTPANTAFNACIELDYIVQFKDLTQQGRYPNGAGATGNIAAYVSNSSGGTTGDDARYQQSVA